MAKYNLLDLFSGIGGFRLGLEMAGFEFNKTYHSDIEEYPNKIYHQHWPDSVALGDVSKINPNTLYFTLERIKASESRF